MGGIFINYRREDAAPWAGRLYERLARELPRNQLLIDVDAIEPGLDFVRALDELVSGCDVLLAIIGPTWVEARNAEGFRRLDDPNDFVRIELDSALKRDIRVIPVLIDGAKMPRAVELPEPLKPLARRNAVRVSREHFGADTRGLVEVLQRLLAPARAGFRGLYSKPAMPRSPSSSKRQQARASASQPVVPEPEEAPFSTETCSVASHKPNDTALRDEVVSSAIIDAKSRTPIVLAAVFALASFPIVLAMPLLFGFFGLLAGAILMVVSALVLLRRRWAEITGTEIALYWLGLSAVAFAIGSLFVHWSSGHLNSGWLAGAILMVVSALVLLRRRWAEITGTEIALYWLGLSFAVAFAMGPLFGNLFASTSVLTHL